ncbi:23S rRNA (uracil(1939)-C(5))-methyltransferase RlmD [Aliagarivorans taiwanensis]|uniref:23S rRNA (uracil(1939)-C(5))-methyltransferase RlmD n=1 Tax=Aliagarivorans taiwanensis TaxID=561966 RepID=UPI000403FE67|nr:23S rRNA (uracil(1939)-C(5))-methyltransferase RlmD [Aliagarivorans taiwanensis]
MAQIFKAPRLKKQPKIQKNLKVESLDHHLNGVVKSQGKTWFVADALPGELIDIQAATTKDSKARLLKRHNDSEQRVAPHCQYYARCGGCSAQHLSSDDQREYKKQAVANLLSRFSGYQELPEIEVLAGADWHYRRVTRMSTWYQGGWQLGFRQKASKQLICVDACPVLSQPLSALIQPLAQLLSGLSRSAKLGHVELIDAQPKACVVVRVSGKLTPQELELFEAFASKHGVLMQLKTDQQVQHFGGAEGEPARLFYPLGDEQKVYFEPGSFIQVNEAMNQRLVERALEYLAVEAEHRVLDLYSGVGNFTLPLAQRCSEVVAVEGVAAMSEQIKANAKANGLDNIQAFTGDLELEETAKAWQKQRFDRILLDPARAGAKQAIERIAKMATSTVVYVSCNPATLARDAAVLKAHNYRLSKLTLVDMFPHTEHIETIAAFSLK